MVMILLTDVIAYTNTNRTQHTSQRCGPRWVI